jgi:hypothetical protein
MDCESATYMSFGTNPILAVRVYGLPASLSTCTLLMCRVHPSLVASRDRSSPVLSPGLYTIPGWTRQRANALLSACILQNPTNFFMWRLAGMTLPVEDIFCILDDPTDDSQRIGLASGIRDLPSLVAGTALAELCPSYLAKAVCLAIQLLDERVPTPVNWKGIASFSLQSYYTAKIRPYCRISQRTQPVPKYVVPLLRHFDKLVRESQECFVPAPCASTAGRSIIGTHSFTLRAFYFLCYSY